MPRLNLAACSCLAVLTLWALPGHASSDPTVDLAQLCDSYWQGYLESHPVAATEIGVHRWDDRWDDITPAGVAAEKGRLESVQARAQAIPDTLLSPADRISRAMLLLEV